MADVEFAGKPDSLLQTDCVICHLVLQNPCETNCCGKFFCRACIEKYHTTKKTCPSCRRNLAWHESKAHESLIKQLKVVCKHKDRGCEWVGELGHLDKHINDTRNSSFCCKFAFLNCSRCHQQVARTDFTAHMSGNCLKNTKCPNFESGCTFEAQRGTISQHLNLDPAPDRRYVGCGYVKLDCMHKCGQKLFRKELKKHEPQCQLEVIACEFNVIGCKGQVPRKDMSAHIDQPGHHMRLMCQACVKFQQTSDESQSKLQGCQASLKNYNRECQQMFHKSKSQVEDLHASLQTKSKAMESEAEKRYRFMERKIRYEVSALQHSVDEKTHTIDISMNNRLNVMKKELSNDFMEKTNDFLKQSTQFWHNLLVAVSCGFVFMLLMIGVFGYQQHNFIARYEMASQQVLTDTRKLGFGFHVFPTLFWPNFTLTLESFHNGTEQSYIQFSTSGLHHSLKASVTLGIADSTSFLISKLYTTEVEFVKWRSENAVVSGSQLVQDTDVAQFLINGLGPFTVIHVRTEQHNYPPHMLAVCNLVMNQKTIFPFTSFKSPFGLFRFGLFMHESNGHLQVVLHADHEHAVDSNGKLKTITVSLNKLSGNAANFSFSILDNDKRHTFFVMPFRDFLKEFIGNTFCLTLQVLFVESSTTPDSHQNMFVPSSKRGSYFHISETSELSSVFDSSNLSPEEDSSELSPEEDSSELPLKEDSSGLSLKEDSSELSPEEDSSELLLKEDSSSLSPKEDSSKLSPEEDSSNLSPKEDSSELSPEEDSSELPLKEDSSSLSPKEDSSELSPEEDSSELPLKEDSTKFSIKEDFSKLPLKEDSSELPPEVDSTKFSPEKDSTKFLPEDDSSELPLEEDSGKLLEDDSFKLLLIEDSAKLPLNPLKEDSGKLLLEEDSFKLLLIEDSAKLPLKEEIPLEEDSGKLLLIENSAKLPLEADSFKLPNEGHSSEHSVEEESQNVFNTSKLSKNSSRNNRFKDPQHKGMLTQPIIGVCKKVNPILSTPLNAAESNSSKVELSDRIPDVNPTVQPDVSGNQKLNKSLASQLDSAALEPEVEASPQTHLDNLIQSEPEQPSDQKSSSIIYPEDTCLPMSLLLPLSTSSRVNELQLPISSTGKPGADVSTQSPLSLPKESYSSQPAVREDISSLGKSFNPPDHSSDSPIQNSVPSAPKQKSSSSSPMQNSETHKYSDSPEHTPEEPSHHKSKQKTKPNPSPKRPSSSIQTRGSSVGLRPRTPTYLDDKAQLIANFVYILVSAIILLALCSFLTMLPRHRSFYFY